MTLADKKILIIDDSCVDAFRLMKISAKLGITSCHVTDPLQAVQKATELKPELIIMDLDMPEQDGYETTAQLKSCPATKSIPVAIITSRTSETEKIISECVGAVHFLPKPVSIGVLRLLLEKVGLLNKVEV